MTLDRFPVNVDIDGTVYPTVKLMVTPKGDVRLFGVKNGDVALIAASTAAEMPDPYPRSRNWVLQTEDGPWKIEMTGGCGCNHPIKKTGMATFQALGWPT